ncbi:proteoglycan 4b isoform X2 [Pagrus major]|uniref:proteoglycan 4b isoform X2 n=1 Tax=Pagrus major TaxID=143350 RepID=UPI003CC8431B
MASTVLSAVILLASAFTFSAAQTSCKGRCGLEYDRGSMCQCDYNCLTYDECCKDYESQCTTSNSCKGRCGEQFKRGRRCSCDSDCMNFNQCCSDHKTHCDAEEPTLNEGADDHLIPLVSPTSYPQDDVTDDMYSQIDPNDEFSDNGVEDLEASPIPESTSGYGLSTADRLDQISVEPTQDPDPLEFSTEMFTVVSQTEMTPSDDEPTQADDSPVTLYPVTEEAPTESSDDRDPTSSGTTLPQPTTEADHVSSQTPPTSAPQTEHSPTANNPELEAIGEGHMQLEVDIISEAEATDLPVASSDVPEVTTTAPSVSTGPTQASSTAPENSQVTFITASSTQESTPIPEATTSNPDDSDINKEDVTAGPQFQDIEDPSISVSPAEPDALTTHIPSSTDAVQDDTADDVTADQLNVTPDPTKPTLSDATSKPQDKPEPYKPPPSKPSSSKPEKKPLVSLNIDDSRDYQADASNDTNLCSGRPVSGLTTLRNGTIVVFRGHYFWFLDSNRVPGPAQGITQVWGVPSPIDTVFTRCNCQGKTYIFKGPQYWRFENDVLDTGYPKVIETGFDGLRGHITAALSVPQYQRRKEAVYFFKRGGLVQKYSYQYGTSQTCGRKPQYAIYTVRNRVVRQAASFLGPAVNIRTSWRGFPSTITAAVSIPSIREPEGYKYYVYSRSKSYNVRMEGERPVIPAPAANTSPQSNNVIKCPKKV